jgi:hypothetical protein
MEEQADVVVEESSSGLEYHLHPVRPGSMLLHYHVSRRLRNKDARLSRLNSLLSGTSFKHRLRGGVRT